MKKLKIKLQGGLYGENLIALVSLIGQYNKDHTLTVKFTAKHLHGVFHTVTGDEKDSFTDKLSIFACAPLQGKDLLVKVEGPDEEKNEALLKAIEAFVSPDVPEANA